MLHETSMRELNGSFVKQIAEDWALLTAGTQDSFNTMTVSWGGVGELWGKDVVFVFVRPQRYTYEFMEKYDTFTLSFFGGAHKKELGFCGKNSGRDTDKVKACGLTVQHIGAGVTFQEAKTAVLCKKIAYQDINPQGFLDKRILDSYQSSDYHRVYIGEILKVLSDD